VRVLVQGVAGSMVYAGNDSGREKAAREFVVGSPVYMRTIRRVSREMLVFCARAMLPPSL